MKHAVFSFMKEHGISSSHKLLCAVSGGMDSVAMLRVLVELGHICGVAHCNFNLRGKESDQDAEFVKKLAEKFALPFYSISFDTLNYAQTKNYSIQMAARELRYEWFEKIRLENSYDYIAVAQHADDEIETVLINLVRGTGISGLTGISPVKNSIIRPLIQVWNKDISDYCKTFELQYRTDRSNSDTKYARNLVRHQVIPLLAQINPGFKQTMHENIEHFTATEKLLLEKTEELSKKFIKTVDSRIEINLKDIPDEVFSQGLFFEMIRSLGFNATEAGEIERLLNSQSGKMLTINDLRILKDRDSIIIDQIKKTINKEFILNFGTRFISEPIVLNLEYIRVNLLRNIPNSTEIACLDSNKLKFPLHLRKWQNGDKFKPLGMKNFKKLSDFYSDLKLSMFEKDNTWLLCSDNDIAWVVGYRIDERYKITDDTREVLRVSL